MDPVYRAMDKPIADVYTISTLVGRQQEAVQGCIFEKDFARRISLLSTTPPSHPVWSSKDCLFVHLSSVPIRRAFLPIDKGYLDTTCWLLVSSCASGTSLLPFVFEGTVVQRASRPIRPLY